MKKKAIALTRAELESMLAHMTNKGRDVAILEIEEIDAEQMTWRGNYKW